MIARNIWLLTFIFNIHLSVVHIPGKNNALADLLSRWNVIKDNHSKLCQLKPQHGFLLILILLC